MRAPEQRGARGRLGEAAAKPRESTWPRGPRRRRGWAAERGRGDPGSPAARSLSRRRAGGPLRPRSQLGVGFEANARSGPRLEHGASTTAAHPSSLGAFPGTVSVVGF